VIGNDDDGVVGHQLAGEAEQVFPYVRIERDRTLAIGPQELLIAGDITHLYGRRALRLHENMGFGTILRLDEPTDLSTSLVIADNRNERGSRAQSPKVAQYISGAAEGLHFALDPQHRDRRLGRDPLDLAVNVVVKHHIADTQYTARLKPVDDR